MPRPSVRLLALGGVIGPVTFVATWAIAGATTRGYSPVGDAISDLAALHAPRRDAMTPAFVTFGVGVIAFGLALRAVGAGPTWISAVATACFTLAVAATPLGGPTRDVVHGVFASLGYVTLVGVPLLAARPLARADHPGWARYAIVTAIIAGASLLASAVGPAHGLWQRIGLTTGDAWIVAMAVQLAFAASPFEQREASN